jgi:lysophospholipase L1-like esterase
MISFELVAGVFFKPNHLDQIKAVLQEDHSFFWHQKKNLNTVFFGGQVQTDEYGFRKHPHEFRNPEKKILVLGASPSFGWGVDNNKTYSYLLEKKLNQRKVKYNVINGSGIGFSSFQGVELLKGHLERINPDIVLISYMINDIDQFRFYQNNGVPDNRVKIESEYIIKARNLFDQLISYQLLKSLITSKSAKRSIYTAAPNSGLRVSLEDYKGNLHKLIGLVSSRNKTPMLIKVPVNLPINSISKNNDIQIKWAKKITKRGLLYNQALEEVAKELGIELIDLPKNFALQSEYLFLDKSDTIHFNELGHELIASIIERSFYEN